jgi:hypothetical protein
LLASLVGSFGKIVWEFITRHWFSYTNLSLEP